MKDQSDTLSYLNDVIWDLNRLSEAFQTVGNEKVALELDHCSWMINKAIESLSGEATGENLD